MKVSLRVLALILAFAIPVVFSFEARAAEQGDGGAQANGSVIVGKVYTFQKIADGIYYTTSKGPMNTGGNHTIIIGDRNVLLVDDGTTPSAGRALLEDIKLVTDKPIRWVINTHFHYDHTDGNSIFGPDVEIIGHEYVRHVLADVDIAHNDPLRNSLTNMPIQIDALKKQVGDEKDPQKRAALQTRVAAMQADLDELKALKPVPPNVTFTSKMTLYQGPREIQLLFLGRGHTSGDTVVFLPKERIVCTGDLMESQVAYMGDGVFDEWITSLGALKNLDFDTVLPGHGVPFHDKALITAFQSYLKDFIVKVAELRKQGLSPEEAAPKVDMTSHESDFSAIHGPGAEIRGVRRMYEWLGQREKP